jgi:hypothetical protein
MFEDCYFSQHSTNYNELEQNISLMALVSSIESFSSVVESGGL